jgi:hypothetical protein
MSKSAAATFFAPLWSSCRVTSEAKARVLRTQWSHQGAVWHSGRRETDRACIGAFANASKADERRQHGTELLKIVTRKMTAGAKRAKDSSPDMDKRGFGQVFV